MILAGDAIDASLGVSLGISTLAAAGLGNMISDVAGVGLGDTIEGACIRLGMAAPALTAAQAGASSTRWVKTGSSVVGIAVGCLLGMCPLLFLDNRKDLYFDGTASYGVRLSVLWCRPGEVAA